MKFSKFLIFLFSTSSAFAQTIEFDAHRFIYFQDSDYNYSTDEHGKITKTGNDIVGTYTFPLSVSADGDEISISNSVVNNHRMVAINANRKIIYMLETRGSLERGSKNIPFEQLPEGNYVTVFNYGKNALEPSYRFPVAFNPTAITLDPTDKYLVVSSETGGNEVVVYELDDFGKPIRNVPRINFFESGSVSDVLWHPKYDFLLFVRKESKDLGLIKVVKDKNSIIRLEQYADVVKFEGNPKSAIFSKDGKYAFVLDEGDEENAAQVYLVKINLEIDGKHALMSRIGVDANPSQLTLHPNGEHIILTHHKESYKEKSLGNSSMTILNFKNDLITLNSNHLLSGIRPAQVKFDKSGKNFMLAYFQTKDFGRKVGGLNFYKFNAGPKATITKQDTQINLPVGVHYLEVLP